jgi:hypothetical protein
MSLHGFLRIIPFAWFSEFILAIFVICARLSTICPWLADETHRYDRKISREYEHHNHIKRSTNAGRVFTGCYGDDLNGQPQEV